MKHFTETIPVSLAEKLKEKGCEHPYAIPEAWEYGFIFDWLMEKGINIRIESDWDTETQIVTKLACGFYIEKIGMRPFYVDCPTWHEAANAAIEKALELI